MMLQQIIDTIFIICCSETRPFYRNYFFAMCNYSFKSSPLEARELITSMKVYAILGLPGCAGSIDDICSLEMTPANML